MIAKRFICLPKIKMDVIVNIWKQNLEVDKNKYKSNEFVLTRLENFATHESQMKFLNTNPRIPICDPIFQLIHPKQYI